MDENGELSSLEKVRRRLYDPTAPTEAFEPQLPERAAPAAKGWEKLKRTPRVLRTEAEHISGPARFFIVALAFFLITGGGALFYLIYGGRIVSTNNVDVAVQGPTTIASGDTVPLLVTIENRNPTSLRGARLTIEFPEGTKSGDDPSQPLTVYSSDVGDIQSGGQVQETIRASVFGSEGQQVTLPLKLEYHTDTSNATFVKRKQFGFTITSSPISIAVQSLSQVSAGQSVTLDVTVRSNASAPVSNVGLLAEYPFGFTPTKADPAPTTGTLFSLGTLAPGEERHISITGVVAGGNNDQRAFKFSAGTLAGPNLATLSTSFTSKQAVITLTKPFLDTTLSVGGDTSASPVITTGMPVPVTVAWTNTLPNPISNARISVAISGPVDPATITGTGFYRSTDSTVLFDASTNPGLAMLQPGDTGQGTFSFAAKRGANATITLAVSVAGQRLSESGVPETLSASVIRSVKVGTNLSLAPKIVRSTGPFQNVGPWPPEANKETTYTVILTLANSGNAVAGAQVTAALPSYVRFTGATSPADGSITYNDATRTVTWSAGDIATGGTGKTAAFQIALTPSITQVDSSPVLLYAQQVSAVDRFTQRTITGSMPALTTQTAADPAYKPEFGKVK